MADLQAWGGIERTRYLAEQSAEMHMYRLATSRGEVVVGPVRNAETRKTPTGFQSRVNARTRPIIQNGRHG